MFHKYRKFHITFHAFGRFGVKR